ncbi:MAG: uracil-DNA glycosylase [Oscillospiraceae bacterium]|nr:uracil-DNA glycosylase [Oscillospiraceae bacterium]
MNLNELNRTCQSCQKCSLGKTRRNLVFGDGNPASPLMFVGEVPGQQEDATGIPFVGKAGQFLDDMLDLIDLDRSKYYICNIVKCRPPENRDPLPEEQDACMEYLRTQVRIIRPKLIVCLGRIAAMRLIRSDYKISREHGQWVQRGQFQMTALYHPAALLRNPRSRPDTFLDLKGLQAKINEVCPELYR